MLPNLDTTDKYVQFTSNKWGMRDFEYEKIPPPNTIRIAIIGASNEVGRGVKNNQVFEQIVERRLNKNYGSDSLKFELLNFAVPGNSFILHQETMRKKVLAFQPSYVLYFTHNRDMANTAYKSLKRDLLEMPNYQENPQSYRDEVPWFEAFEQFILNEKIVVDGYLPEGHQDIVGAKILKWSFSNLEQITKGKDIQNIMVYVLSVLEKKSHFNAACGLTKGTSFQCVDLSGAFDHIADRRSLVLNSWDSHPNIKGHQLIANALYKELVILLGLKKSNGE